MAVPFGFSVGDILALGKVLKDATTALRDSGGAAEDYQDAMAQFRTWSFLLQEINHLTPDQDSVTDVNAIKGQAQSLQHCFQDFANKIAKFEKHLGVQTVSKLGRGAFAKLKWATLVEKELQSFKESMAQQISSLLVLMQLVSQKQHFTLRSDIANLQNALTVTSSSITNEIHGKLASTLTLGSDRMTTQIIDSEARLSMALKKLEQTQSLGLRQILDQNQTASSKTIESSASSTPRAADQSTDIIEACQSSGDQAGSTDLVHQVARLSESLINAFNAFLGYSSTIVHLLMSFFIRLLLQFWPQLLDAVRNLSRVPDKLIAYSQAECIKFEDVFGRVHFLPATYYRDWDIFVRTLQLHVSGLPNSAALLKRIRADKFQIVDASMKMVPVSDWALVARPRSRFFMSVMMDELHMSDELGSAFQCPRSRCSGSLVLEADKAYRCQTCSRVFHKRGTPTNIGVTKLTGRPTVPTNPQSGSLEDLLYHTQDPLFQKMTRDEAPFLGVHTPFQQSRRLACERFIEHCDKRIKRLESMREACSQTSFPVSPPLQSPAMASEAIVASEAYQIESLAVLHSNVMSSKFDRYLSSARDNAVRLRMTQIPGVVGMHTTYNDIVHLNYEKARIRKAERHTHRAAEAEEINAYKRIHLVSAADSDEAKLLDAIRLNDAVKAAAGVVGASQNDASPDNIKSASALQIACIAKNGFLVDVLLELGSCPFVRGKNDETPLVTAIVGGDLSILLSMLAAADCLWAEYMNENILDETAFALAVRDALVAAVHTKKHLVVELLLLFGADPFLRQVGAVGIEGESAFEAAARLGHEDVIAIFLAEAVELNYLLSSNLAAIVHSINAATAEEVKIPLPQNPNRKVNFCRTQVNVSGEIWTYLQYLESDNPNFGSIFTRAPLTIVAGLSADTLPVADLLGELLKSLRETRMYFVYHEIESFSLINRITQFFDRAIESVREINEEPGANQSIVNAILRKCHSTWKEQSPFRSIEIIQKMITSVDPGFPFFSLPILNQTSYWRLQTEGLIFILLKLTEIKRRIRGVNDELIPIWSKLNEIRHGWRHGRKLKYHVPRPALGPKDAHYILSFQLGATNRVVAQTIDVEVMSRSPSDGDDLSLWEGNLNHDKPNLYESFQIPLQKYGAFASIVEITDTIMGPQIRPDALQDFSVEAFMVLVRTAELSVDRLLRHQFTTHLEYFRFWVERFLLIRKDKIGGLNSLETCCAQCGSCKTTIPSPDQVIASALMCCYCVATENLRERLKVFERTKDR